MNVTWPMVALGELMPGRGESIDPADHPDETFDLYSIPAYDSQKPEVALGAQIGSTKQAVKPGDVLLSKIVPHIRRAWVVGGHGRATKDRIQRVDRVSQPSNVPWLYAALLREDCFHAKFMNTVSGVGGSLLRARPAHVAKIEIPLPPFSEQRRIVEILNKAEALQAKRRAAIAQLDALAQSIFLDAHKKTAIQSCNLTLAKVAEPTRGSFVNGPFGSDLLTSELQDEEVPVIYIRDIREGEYRRVSTVCVSERKAKELAVCSVKPGDILVAKVGDPPGIAALYPMHLPPAVITQDVIRIRVDPDVAVSEYIVSYLNSSVGRWKVAGITTQATRARFSVGDFKGVKIELPPISTQREFARRVSAVEKLKTAQRESLAQLDVLFAALQHCAFRGEL